MERVGGELRFHFDPPDLGELEAVALVGGSDYRLPMPLTVDIAFDIAGRPGVRRHLWMTASPIDPEACRTFWTVARNDGHDEPDEPHLEFQALVLAEDEPVVCNQVPPELPLDPGAELHVRADRVSVEYRRWLIDLVRAARSVPADAGGPGDAGDPNGPGDDPVGRAVARLLGLEPAGPAVGVHDGIEWSHG
jgi:hypothetical protein